MFLSNGRAGIINLASNEVTQEDIKEDSFFGKDYSVGCARELADRHGDDSVVLASGLLAGSLIPSACCGFAVGARTEDGSRGLAPILGFAGVDLKLTGFDAIVIKGSSPQAGYLWIRDGIIELVPVPEMESLDSWARTDKIRAAQGDPRIQVLSLGPAGSRGLASSQLVNGYWGGEDKLGLAADLGRKRLVAVALRGMGELDVSDPDEHFETTMRVRTAQIQRLGENRGLASYANAAKREDFQSLVHRHVACFGCPFPCRSYLKVNEDPRLMKLGHAEPGYLHYDIAALEEAFAAGLDAKEATYAMVLCAKHGVEPVTVLSASASGGAGGGAHAIEQLLKDYGQIGTMERVRNFEASFQDTKDYELCLGLGLCPRYWSRVGLDLLTVSGCAEPALGRGL